MDNNSNPYGAVGSFTGRRSMQPPGGHCSIDFRDMAYGSGPPAARPGNSGAFSGIVSKQPPGGNSSLSLGWSGAPAAPFRGGSNGSAYSSSSDLSSQLSLPYGQSRGPPSAGRRSNLNSAGGASVDYASYPPPHSIGSPSPYQDAQHSYSQNPARPYGGYGQDSQVAAAMPAYRNPQGSSQMYDPPSAGPMSATGRYDSSGYPSSYAPQGGGGGGGSSAYGSSMAQLGGTARGNGLGGYSQAPSGQNYYSSGAQGGGAYDSGAYGSSAYDAYGSSGYGGSHPGAVPSSAPAYGSSEYAGSGYRGGALPVPASIQPFQVSKGQFCGKMIVQPPGGRTSINIFGG